MPPLDGLRVIDLTRVLAGPYCAMLLGDMGADVIKIEEPNEGDEARTWAPFVGPWSAYFLGVNRSKRSLGLDLKTPDGAETLRQLLRDADVFLENFRPGSLEKLGFGYDAVHALNPRLVYTSITGYGRTGPRRHLAGYDPIVQAESGFMDITGSADGPPTRTGIAMTDYLAGLYAFSGVLLALRDRERTGRGQQVDIALFDSVFSTLSMPIGILQAGKRQPTRMGNAHSAIAPYETLRASDGMVMVAAPNSRLWKQLCTAIGAAPLINDPRFAGNTDRVKNRPELRRELEAVLAQFTVDEVVAKLEKVSVPAGRVRTVAQAIEDPQIEPRQMLLAFDDPELAGFRVVGNPIKLSANPANPSRRPPKLAEHTEEILEELRTRNSKLILEPPASDL